MKVIATNLGKRRQIIWKGETYDTGIYKTPVDSIFLGKENVVQDVVLDREKHIGIDNAVYAYNVDHYPYWKEQYPNLEWDFGMFGENLSVEGMNEAQLYVGSSYKVGEAIIEVVKPREPCVKLGMRFNDAMMIKRFWKNNKTGIYFKVLQTGQVKPGDKFILISEKKENKTIAEVYDSWKLKNKI